MSDRRGRRVFAVHSTKADNVGAMEVVFDTEVEARTYAAERSADYHIVCAAVTSFRVGQLGTRMAVAWYEAGREQPLRRWRGTPLHVIEQDAAESTDDDESRPPEAVRRT